MTAVALSLAAALTWGCSDFAAGLKSRRWPVATVLVWVEGGALVAALGLIAATGEPLPDGRTVVFSLLAGICGLSGLAAFYRGLAIGSMSIVAPISATGVALPVVVGIATGDRLGVIVACGLAVIALGVIVASRAEGVHGHDAARGSSVLLALVAAAGFGGYFTLGDVAADGSILWLLALARVAMLPLVGAVVLRQGHPMPPASERLALIVVGLGDLGATSLYALASTHGELAVVAVVGSLYPVGTLVLARIVLAERLSRSQMAGVAAALVGVGLVSVG